MLYCKCISTINFKTCCQRSLVVLSPYLRKIYFYTSHSKVGRALEKNQTPLSAMTILFSVQLPESLPDQLLTMHRQLHI